MAEQERSERVKKVESWVEHAPSAHLEEPDEQVADRIQLVIEAAERAAEAIRVDAQQQAQRYLAEAQRRADRLTSERVRLIAGLTDELIEHAGAVRSHSEQMVASLEHTIETVTAGEHGALGEGGSAELPSGGPGEGPEAPADPIAEEAAPDPAPEGFESYPEAPEGVTAYEGESVEPPAAGDVLDSPEEGGSGVEEEAQLRATRLALDGSSREEIAAALRTEHGIDDPDPILDRVMGS